MNRKNILLVDDDAVLRNMIKMVLEREYRVFEAPTFQSAAGLLDRHMDLAIIDYMLPDRNGFELIREIKRTMPAVPVILITAYGTEAVAIKAIRTGVRDYIKKPLSLVHLQKRISEILDGRGDGFYTIPVKKRDEFIMQAITGYVEENYMEALSLESVSKMLYIDRYRFCRLFKKRIGCGFREYLNRVRVRNATEMMKNPDLTITEVAFAAGYGSIVHFERMFRKFHGIPPREYRRNIQNQ